MTALLSQPFADVGVADRGREEGEAQRRHEDVHHEKLLCVRFSGAAMRGSAAFVRVRGATRRIGFREDGYAEVIGIS
jgi:hypothetical protein